MSCTFWVAGLGSFFSLFDCYQKVMTEVLEKIWSKLTLIKEEQDDIIIEKEWVDDVSEAGQNCAIGKLVMRKLVNVEVMRNIFIKIWRVSEGLTIREVGDKLYIFYFKDPLEKDRVIQKQPWSFNKSLLVMKDFDGHLKSKLLT